jgi:Flp pilus assembly pilin Flp
MIFYEIIKVGIKMRYLSKKRYSLSFEKLNQKGASTVEYALVIFMAVAIIGIGIKVMGVGSDGFFKDAVAKLSELLASGSVETGNNETDNRKGTITNDRSTENPVVKDKSILIEPLDYAFLSQCAYSGECQLPEGWESLDSKRIKELWPDFDFDLDQLTKDKIGFDCSLFYNKEAGQFVLSFRGTDTSVTPEDIITKKESEFSKDLKANAQALGFETDQYNLAVSIAKELSLAIEANTDSELVFTGHSLGGGLASAASVATNKKAVTFNAAGLHKTYQNGKSSTEMEGLIDAYYVEGEMLNYRQEDNKWFKWLPDAVGKKIPLKATEGEKSEFTLHEINQVIEALKERKGAKSNGSNHKTSNK